MEHTTSNNSLNSKNLSGGNDLEETQKKVLIERRLAFQQSILDNATSMIISTDVNGIITSFNKAGERILGYTPEELVEKLSPAAFHDLSEVAAYAPILSAELGEEIPIGFEIFVAKTKKGLKNTKEWTYITKDGIKFPVELSISAIRNEENEIIGYLGIATDITERKQAEALTKQANEELQATEEELRQNLEELQATQELLQYQKQEIERQSAFQQSILDNATSIIIATDANGIITSFNKAGEQALGYKAEELVGKLSPAAFHDLSEVVAYAPILSAELGEEIPMGFEIFITKTKKGLKNTKEWTYITKDGVKFPVELSISAIRNEENEIIGYLGIAIDITDRKKTEEDLQLLKTLIDNSADAIQAADETGLLVYMNKVGMSRLGITKEQMRKMYVKDFEQAFKEEGAWEAHINEMKAIKKFTLESTNQDRATQRIFPVEVSIQHLTVKGKGYVIGSSRDVTERKKAEEAIKHANEELQATEEELRQNLEELQATQDNLAANEIKLRAQKEQLEQIFDGVPAMIYQFKIDTEGRISFPLVSKGAKAIYGLEAEEIMQNPDSIITKIEPLDLPLFQESMSKSAATLENWVAELRTIVGGQTIWVQGNSKPVKLEDGSILWSGIITDITERKKAEADLRLLETLIDNSADSIQAADETGRLIYVSKVGLNRLGISKEQVQDMYVKDFEQTLQGEGAWENHINEIKAVKQLTIEGINQDKLTQKEFPVEVSIQYILVEDKGYMIATSRDVTERKKTEAIIKQTNEELQATDEELRQNLEELQTTQEELQEQFNLLAVKNKNIADSINYAKRIQDALLPRMADIHSVFPESFVFFKPRDIISGDFYWFANKENEQIIVAADCTGHGVPGAFMSMLGSSLLNQIVHDKEVHQPNLILDLLHSGVEDMLNQKLKNSESRDGMDAAICLINQKEKIIQFAGANNPMYVVTQKPVDFITQPEENNIKITEQGEWLLTEVKGDKRPIGGRFMKHSNVNYPSYFVKINQELHLYLFSDGIIDQIGGAERMKLMSKGFKQLILESHERPAKEQNQFFDTFFANWTSSTQKQLDDILVIGVKITA